MNMTDKRKGYDLKFKLSVHVAEKLVESSLSMKAWFVDGERNLPKSAINLPLKAKREDCLVEGGNHFLEISKKNWWRNAASIQGFLLFKGGFYSRKYGI